MIIKIMTNGEEKDFNIDRLTDISIENDRGRFNELDLKILNATEDDVMDYVINELELDPEDLTYYCTCDKCLKWNDC